MSEPAHKSTIQRFFRYGLITGLSFVVSLGLTVLLHEAARLSAELSYAIALVVVFAMNFLFMRYYIYSASRGSARRQLVLFFLSALMFRGMEYAAFLLVHTVLRAPYGPAIVGIQAVSALVKFFYYRLMVFRAHPTAARTLEPSRSCACPGASAPASSRDA